MNRNDAKRIAATITNDELAEMFQRAKAEIKDWRRPSNVNKGMTLGASWNVIAKNYDEKKDYPPNIKTIMVQEFGDFLPRYVKNRKGNQASDERPLTHQDPIF